MCEQMTPLIWSTKYGYFIFLEYPILRYLSSIERIYQVKSIKTGALGADVFIVRHVCVLWLPSLLDPL